MPSRNTLHRMIYLRKIFLEFGPGSEDFESPNQAYEYCSNAMLEDGHSKAQTEHDEGRKESVWEERANTYSHAKIRDQRPCTLPVRNCTKEGVYAMMCVGTTSL